MAEGDGKKTSYINVERMDPVSAPEEIRGEFPITEAVAETVLRSRQDIRDALSGKGKRQVIIVGPCSIHDPKAAQEYAGKLAKLREKVNDRIIIVMRVYFEKPRTTVGWKGLINDPKMDGSNDINLGLRKARQILLEINSLGLPCATEFLDPIVPQYTSDLVSWAAIGARTTESQTHRQMASGLSMPVGFKNATDGGLQVALDAMVSARHQHAFVGIDQSGMTSIVRTRGNADVHLVLRGGNGQPNYSKAYIAFTRVHLEKEANKRLIMVDCSHGNSGKDYRRQPKAFANMMEQILGGESAILGMMLESYLVEGKQSFSDSMTYGQSITDGCIGWETTESLILDAHKRLSEA